MTEIELLIEKAVLDIRSTYPKGQQQPTETYLRLRLKQLLDEYEQQRLKPGAGGLRLQT